MHATFGQPPRQHGRQQRDERQHGEGLLDAEAVGAGMPMSGTVRLPMPQAKPIISDDTVAAPPLTKRLREGDVDRQRRLQQQPADRPASP